MACQCWADGLLDDIALKSMHKFCAIIFPFMKNYNRTYSVIMMECTKSRQLLWDFLLNNQMVFGVIHMGIDWPFCGIKSDFSYSEKKISANFGDNRNALFTFAVLFYMLFEFSTKNSPTSGCHGSCQLLTTLLFKEIWAFQ